MFFVEIKCTFLLLHINGCTSGHKNRERLTVFPYAERLGKSVVMKTTAPAFKLVERKSRRVKNVSELVVQVCV